MRITDTMQQFLASRGNEKVKTYGERLQEQWLTTSPANLSTTFSLLWSALSLGGAGSTEVGLRSLIGAGRFDDCHLEAVIFNRLATDDHDHLLRSFLRATLIECDFSGLDLVGCQFRGAWLESVNFSSCRLRNVNFDGASLVDVDFTAADVRDCDLSQVEPGLSIRLDDETIVGDEALGVLAARGALVGAIPAIYQVMAHPSYEVAMKIARKVMEPGPSQVLGLTQRGAAAKAQGEAKRFVRLLAAIGFVREDRAGSEKTVEITPDGRTALRPFVDKEALPSEIAGFFKNGG